MQPRAEAMRADAEREFAQQVGSGMLAEVRRAPTSIVIRRAISLPRMIQQPDGTYRPERPSVVAALRTRSGWERITAGERRPLDRLVGHELDRLLASTALWREPAFSPVTCTDPSGPIMVVRHRGRQRVSFQGCGSAGLTGRLAEIVMAGRVRDWSGTPRSAQPEPIRLGRLPQDAMQPYRFSSGIYAARNMVIRDDQEWLGQWRRITSGTSASPPPVDFRREMLLLSGMGRRPTGGYSVEIQYVIDTGEHLEAHVVHRLPGRRCGTTQAITQPIDVVRIPATTKSVRWVVTEARSDCR